MEQKSFNSNPMKESHALDVMVDLSPIPALKQQA